MTLTDTQRELARHALGLTRGKKVTFRNHFVTGEGSKDHAAWMEMVNAGAAKRRTGSALSGGDDIFWLTKAGATAALNRGEKLSAEDFA